MRHDFVVEGYAFRLRPVRDEDAEFIASLRGDPFLNRFLHSSENTVEGQRKWLSEYYARQGDFYFVIERSSTGTSEGLVALYNLDPLHLTAEWGRWIIRSNSMAALESAWLIHRCAFETLNLSEIYCRTVSENASVVSFHDSFGISRRRTLRDFVTLNHEPHDAIEHRIDRSEWLGIAPRLEKLSAHVARRLNPK